MHPKELSVEQMEADDASNWIEVVHFEKAYSHSSVFLSGNKSGCV